MPTSLGREESNVRPVDPAPNIYQEVFSRTVQGRTNASAPKILATKRMKLALPNGHVDQAPLKILPAASSANGVHLDSTRIVLARMNVTCPPPATTPLTGPLSSPARKEPTSPEKALQQNASSAKPVGTAPGKQPITVSKPAWATNPPG